MQVCEYSSMQQWKFICIKFGKKGEEMSELFLENSIVAQKLILTDYWSRHISIDRHSTDTEQMLYYEYWQWMQ